MPQRHLIGPFVRRFLLEELARDRNFSPNTLKSYRDAIRLLFRFLAERHATDPTRVTVEQVDDALLRDFLRDCKERRGNAPATCNQRLAAFHSLFRFIGRQAPELVEQAARIQAIPFRRAPLPIMPYLDKPEIEALLAAPDRRRPQGRRDYAMLLFLYNSGARASEAAGTDVSDLHLATAPSVQFRGKGRRDRVCPLWPRTAATLRGLLGTRLDGPAGAPAFLNCRGQRITRHGIHTLVERSVDKAARAAPSLQRKRVSPHTLRHTTAVHLLRAGVDINTIRAWLGHVSLETTNRYAQVDLEMKARALRTCADNVPDPSPATGPSWHRDSELMDFLTFL